MEFPSTAEFVALNTERKNELVNLFMLSGIDNSVDENLLSWTITSVESE